MTQPSTKETLSVAGETTLEERLIESSTGSEAAIATATTTAAAAAGESSLLCPLTDEVGIEDGSTTHNGCNDSTGREDDPTLHQKSCSLTEAPTSIKPTETPGLPAPTSGMTPIYSYKRLGNAGKQRPLDRAPKEKGWEIFYENRQEAEEESKKKNSSSLPTVATAPPTATIAAAAAAVPTTTADADTDTERNRSMGGGTSAPLKPRTRFRKRKKSSKAADEIYKDIMNGDNNKSNNKDAPYPSVMANGRSTLPQDLQQPESNHDRPHKNSSQLTAVSQDMGIISKQKGPLPSFSSSSPSTFASPSSSSSSSIAAAATAPTTTPAASPTFLSTTILEYLPNVAKGINQIKLTLQDLTKTLRIQYPTAITNQNQSMINQQEKQQQDQQHEILARLEAVTEKQEAQMQHNQIINDLRKTIRGLEQENKKSHNVINEIRQGNEAERSASHKRLKEALQNVRRLQTENVHLKEKIQRLEETYPESTSVSSTSPNKVLAFYRGTKVKSKVKKSAPKRSRDDSSVDTFGTRTPPQSLQKVPLDEDSPFSSSNGSISSTKAVSKQHKKAKIKPGATFLSNYHLSTSTQQGRHRSSLQTNVRDLVPDFSNCYG